jgi:hypothetical protein
LLRIEPGAGRQRITGLTREQLDSERLQPVERVVELLDDHTGERLIRARALLQVEVDRAKAPSEAAGEKHGPARPRALLVDDRLRAELARPGRSTQAGHAGPGDD